MRSGPLRSTVRKTGNVGPKISMSSTPASLLGKVGSGGTDERQPGDVVEELAVRPESRLAGVFLGRLAVRPPPGNVPPGRHLDPHPAPDRVDHARQEELPDVVGPLGTDHGADLERGGGKGRGEQDGPQRPAHRAYSSTGYSSPTNRGERARSMKRRSSSRSSPAAPRPAASSWVAARSATLSHQSSATPS